MPEVKPGENRNSYVARCVRVVMGEGLGQEAAVGKCEGMYDSHVKKSRAAVRKAFEAADSLVGVSQAQRRFEYDRVYKVEMLDRIELHEVSRGPDGTFGIGGRVEKAEVGHSGGATVDDPLGAVLKAAYEEGHVSHRKDGDYKKANGQWVRVPEEGRERELRQGTEKLSAGQARMLDEQAKSNRGDLHEQYLQFKQDVGPDDRTTFQDFARTMQGEQEGLFDTQGEPQAVTPATEQGNYDEDILNEVKHFGDMDYDEFDDFQEFLHEESGKYGSAREAVDAFHEMQSQSDAADPLGSALDSAAKPEVKPEHLHAMADKLEGAQYQANAKEIMSQAQDAYAKAVGAPQAEESENDEEDNLDEDGNEIEPDEDPLREKPAGMSMADWMAAGPDDYAKSKARKSMMKDPLQDELREASKVDKFWESDGDGDPLGNALRVVNGVSKDSHGEGCDCEDCVKKSGGDLLGQVLKSL
jgi:hypothetical protein